MMTHMIDKDRIHTYCGLRVSILAGNETVQNRPTCQTCKSAVLVGLHIRDRYQPWWESQMRTTEA